MSTTAAIGATTKTGWTGGSSYSDGYPLMQGRGLWFIYRTWFKGDVNRFVKWATGHRWRTFLKRNVSLRPTFIGVHTHTEERLTPIYEAMGKGLPPECYCCGEHPEEKDVVTHKSTDGCQWGYVIDAPRRRMRVLKGSPGTWEQVASILLDGKEPDWGGIQCGKGLDRCNHSEGWHVKAVAGSEEYFAAWAATVEGWKAKEDVTFLKGVLAAAPNTGAMNVKDA